MVRWLNGRLNMLSPIYTQSLHEVSSYWPLVSPDITLDAFRKDCGRSIPDHDKVTFSKSRELVYKVRLSKDDYRLHKAAHPLAVDTVGRVLVDKDPAIPDHNQPNNRAQRSKALVWAIIMPLEKTLDHIDTYKMQPKARKSIVTKLIRLVKMLHEKYGIVHGDIKPQNFLCQDGTYRLCDFAEARLLSDDPREWEGLITEETTAPHRCLHPYEATTEKDDLYSLGITIWMLYTGRDLVCPIDNIGGSLKQVMPIDINLITDKEVREKVEHYLDLGGVKV